MVNKLNKKKSKSNLYILYKYTVVGRSMYLSINVDGSTKGKSEWFPCQRQSISATRFCLVRSTTIVLKRLYERVTSIYGWGRSIQHASKKRTTSCPGDSRLEQLYFVFSCFLDASFHYFDFYSPSFLTRDKAHIVWKRNRGEDRDQIVPRTIARNRSVFSWFTAVFRISLLCENNVSII